MLTLILYCCYSKLTQYLRLFKNTCLLVLWIRSGTSWDCSVDGSRFQEIWRLGVGEWNSWIPRLVGRICSFVVIVEVAFLSGLSCLVLSNWRPFSGSSFQSQLWSDPSLLVGPFTLKVIRHNLRLFGWSRTVTMFCDPLLVTLAGLLRALPAWGFDWIPIGQVYLRVPPIGIWLNNHRTVENTGVLYSSMYRNTPQEECQGEGLTGWLKAVVTVSSCWQGWEVREAYVIELEAAGHILVWGQKAEWTGTGDRYNSLRHILNGLHLPAEHISQRFQNRSGWYRHLWLECLITWGHGEHFPFKPQGQVPRALECPHPGAQVILVTDGGFAGDWHCWRKSHCYLEITKFLDSRHLLPLLPF